MIFFFLVGCTENNFKKEINQDKKYEKNIQVDYLKEDILKKYIVESNKITNVVNIIDFHDMIISRLKNEIDFNIPINLQEELISKIIEEILYDWKCDVVSNIVLKENINIYDFKYILNRTSIRDAIDIMIAYEIIYLGKNNK